MEKTYRFGFIFLDEIHHINHFVSIAVALSKKHKVSIITYPAEHQYLKDKLEILGGDRVVLCQLKTRPFRQFTDTLKKRPLPRTGFWVKYNHRYLIESFDALFFTDYKHKTLLKYKKGGSFPKLIKVPHGPAGRAYGYNSSLLDFDLHIVFGKHYYEQLKASNLLGNKTKIAGYFKRDALEGQQLPKLFNNDKPVVLYNPHFTKALTSWHQLGSDILAYFKNQNTFNLIFAPHINLFNKVGIESDKSILEPYQNTPNIHIDLGSVASVDMVYTKLAEIYLGDVSSQAIEFITKPRPCIFINAHNASYEGNHNYHFWKNGQVVDSIARLDAALHRAQDTFPIYKPIQEKATKNDFKTKRKTTATERAVKQIEKFMKKSGL